MQWLITNLKTIIRKKKKKNIYIYIYIFDSISNCDCIQKASHEIHELQIDDIDLLPYFQYLEEGKLPENERDARRIVLESEKMEVIDGVLRHDSAADQLQWCVAVPKELRQDLISEAHASLFSGHLSEREVYDRLRRRFWWQGMRADIRRFCRGCLNCASRRGPGRAVHPPLQPISVLKAFHRVAVDVFAVAPYFKWK
jgi:hypothetical protein